MRALLKESSEDVLTSDVFGSLKYLPRRPYLEAILRLVAERNPRAHTFHQCLPAFVAELETVEFLFWRSYPTPKGIGDDDSNTERDVVSRHKVCSCHRSQTVLPSVDPSHAFRARDLVNDLSWKVLALDTSPLATFATRADVNEFVERVVRMVAD